MTPLAQRLRELADELESQVAAQLVEARLTVSDGERTWTITRRGADPRRPQ